MQKIWQPAMATMSCLVATALSICVGCNNDVSPQQAADSQAIPETPTQPSGPLRIAVVDDPQLADAIEREWGARTNQSFQVLRETEEQLDDVSADVLIFPPARIGRLMQQRMLRRLPATFQSETAYQSLDIFGEIRRQQLRWGGELYTVPFGMPTFSLLARSSSEAVAGASPTDDDAALPDLSTWTELHQWVTETTQAEQPALSSGLLQPLAPGWAGHVLLSRAAAYSYDKSRISTTLNFVTLEPLIQKATYVRALEELVADFQTAVPESIDYTPADVVESFFKGEAHAALTIPLARNSTDIPSETPSFKFKLQQLPGSREQYDFTLNQWESESEEVTRVTLLGFEGRVGGISRFAKHPDQASRFLGWATGPEAGESLCQTSRYASPFRESHSATHWLPQPMIDEADRYMAQLSVALETQPVVSVLRIPGQDQLMAVLDEAVRAAARGDKAPQLALNEAAQQWRTILNSFDRDQLLELYQQSLNY